MAPRQAERRFGVTGALGEDQLLFRSLSAHEHLSRPFEYKLELLSEDPDIEIEDVLGQNLTIRYDLVGEEKTRYFNGFVSEFHFHGMSGQYYRYRAVLRPWLWFLTRTADCRIFQEKTLPEIIKQIFDDLGFTDYEDKLNGEHESWTYCVQYRETDFDFVSRLMEQEGIYYYFKHEDGKHTLILADSPNAPEATAGWEEIPYFPPSEQNVRERDHLWDWNVGKKVQPGKFVQTDYNFELPRTDLETRLNRAFEHPHADYEIYDYPGEYATVGVGTNYTSLRLEELRSQHERVEGSGDVGGATAGALFNFINYPREDQNREYLIVSAQIDLSSDAYETGHGNGESECRCTITALESATPFRPPRITPKSIVRGPQTAIVVGPSDEEIYTDQHGRVKVQFHWDREGENDENSSCWMRVSYPWAGRNWGAIAIPRIGQEVIVDFLEGDPDQPIIVGRFYNGDNRPPYTLPDSKVISGVKSNSTKGGGGYNEISMDDTKGSEKLTIHGQFDMDTTIENDQSLTVHNNRTGQIDVDDALTIDNNQTLTVGVDQTMTVGSKQTVDIGTDQTVTVGANRSLTVQSNLTDSISGNRTVSVNGADALSVSGNRTVSVSGNIEVSGTNITINGSASIDLIVGGSSISITPGGVTINSSGVITITGSLVNVNS